MNVRTKQLDLWQGPWGDMYQDRNKVDPENVTKRMEWWTSVLKQIYLQANHIPESFLEVGAGQGPNLLALQSVYMTIGKSVDLYATEINDKARLALSEINNVKLLDGLTDSIAECVFTMGLLIHIHPAHLKPLMRDIYKASKRWIVCAEYFAPETRAIPYHGEADALWLDDYGSKWLEMFPLRVMGYGFLWKRMTGLDNLTYWMLEKTQ